MSVFGTAVGPCPCGSGEAYAACCEPLHLGASEAPTAEALMRSRYSAHALGVADYVLRTWHPRHRPASLHLDPGTRWTGLDIDRVTGGGVEDAHGVVEFRAHYVSGGRQDELREVSRFERRAGRWFYVDGETG
jgi:SEC-C motif-containing protein